VSSGVGKTLQDSGSCLGSLRLHIRKTNPLYSSDSLESRWHEIVARTRTPDGDVWSVMQYLHNLVKQGLVAWPSADSAILKLTSEERPVDGRIHLWTLRCASYRSNTLRSRVEFPYFTLRFHIEKSKTHHKLGSHLSTNKLLIFDLFLRPKASFIEYTAKGTTDQDPTHTISFAVIEMTHRIRKELLHRTLTSHVSLYEAAVQSLDRNFRSSILHKYVELKGVKASGTCMRPSGRLEGRLERLWQEAAPSSTSISRPVLLSEELHPSASSSATANHQHLKLVCMLEPRFRAVAD
jgi:hypothetical protein